MTTILLIALFICFVVQKIAEGVWGAGWVDSWFALSTQGLEHWRVYQLITFQFMHSGLWHLFGNMIGLYFFGRAMEETLGRKGLLKLYLLSGTIGGLLQVALAFSFPNYFSGGVVGASAGVFGLIAAFATRAPDQPITLLLFFILPVTFQARVFLLIEAFISLAGLLGPLVNFTAMTGNIAHAAHLGGMLTGIFYIRWAGKTPRLFEFWRPFARQPPPPRRELVGTAPRRAWRGASRPPADDLPPAEFISREVDPILEKISAQGINSLTERERQILEAARNKMAKR
jgi:membrane associated rhomboid family serine protease